MVGYIILGFLWWIVIWYVVFYFRYANRDVVDELRNNLKVANKEVRHLNTEYEEFFQQNEVLKAKVQELYEKNDDLSKIVSELSKYYYHIKKASEKTVELTKFLQDPDPLMEEKMRSVIDERKEEQKKMDEKIKEFF